MLRRLLVLAVVLTLVGAACGGGDDDNRGAGAAPVELSGTVNDHGKTDLSGKGDEAELELEQDDFYFGPTFVKAKSGQKIEVEIENEGKATHTFTIDELSIDETLKPGEKKAVDVTIPKGGTFVYYCRFHRGRGMQGAFYTTAGGSSSPSTTGSSGY